MEKKNQRNGYFFVVKFEGDADVYGGADSA